MSAFPLPNDVKRPGDLCPKSFASNPANHVDPAEHEEWGICRDCGEVLNIRSGRLPEHTIPVARVAAGGVLAHDTGGAA